MMETATAAEPIPFGSPIRLNASGARVSKTEEMNGIAKRPWVRGNSDSHYGRGETVFFQTDGECLALIGANAKWVDLRGGKIVE